MTIYNKKGEASAKQFYTVSGYKNSGESPSASVAREMFDKKGKSFTNIQILRNSSHFN